uniref:Uncharacterized protein n=1 Tax=virus sp. ct1Uu26 TaxID=2826789 RepID=A0A8S5R7Y1_9VIRU|nr:MAG TPA: hypothetical protein [virus sp. ct1Uu26]
MAVSLLIIWIVSDEFPDLFQEVTILNAPVLIFSAQIQVLFV